MTFYARMQALADRQIAGKGSPVTIRAKDTPSDPVHGYFDVEGATRTINAVLTQVDYKTFPETLAQAGDLMLLCDAGVVVGEKWINGTEEWSVVAVKEITPDNSTLLAVKALVRG